MKMVNRNSLPGQDDISRTSLSNGITILARSNFNSPSVVIGGYFTGGSLFDKDEKLGLAAFTADALLRGSRKHTFQRIFDMLESAGASLSFAAGGHTVGFTGRSLVEDLPLLLALLADSIRHPIFPHEQVERLRTQILTGLSLRAQDTADMAAITFDKIIYGSHPYSRPDEGWPETVRAITRKDLVEFHQLHYGPRGFVIALVGAIHPESISEQVEAVLGNWRNSSQPDLPSLPELKPLKKTITRKVRIQGKFQTDLVIGSSGPRRKDPEFLSASLGNSVLGQFGMHGRIGEVVREKSGLAYTAISSLNAGIGPGSWEVSAGVNPDNIQKARDLIFQELTRFVDEGVTGEELIDSQSNFIGRLPLSLESNAGVVGALLNIERFDLGFDYYRHYPEMIWEVTPDDVLQAARKYLHPDKMAVVIAGP
jgi:zinc protease